MPSHNAIRKPSRSYPHPVSIRDLDDPHRGATKARYVRVDVFKNGFVPGDNPFVDRPGKSPSDILNKI